MFVAARRRVRRPFTFVHRPLHIHGIDSKELILPPQSIDFIYSKQHPHEIDITMSQPIRPTSSPTLRPAGMSAAPAAEVSWSDPSQRVPLITLGVLTLLLVLAYLGHVFLGQ